MTTIARNPDRYPDCRDCVHYRKAGHTELVPLCGRTEPARVAWDERKNGECGEAGKLFAERQPSIFDAWD